MVLGSATECYDGVVTLLADTDTSDLTSVLPGTRCTPQEGICYSGLTYSKGVQVASFGCWPGQTDVYGYGIAWYGTPECKNEVAK